MKPTLEKQAEQTAICDCGREYNLSKRIKEAGKWGTAAKYCSDKCWVEYTSSQDTLDPNLMSDERYLFI